MFDNLTPARRHGVAALRFVFVLYILAASVVSLLDPPCRDRTLALTLDGIAVGGVIAVLELLALAGRPKRTPTVVSLYCVARLLVGHHARLGIAGGYTFGITLAAIECLV